MATIGQSLTAPESGWKRYDDTHENFKYIGEWIENTNSQYYNQTIRHATSDGTDKSKIVFRFFGTAIRILGNNSSNTAYSSNDIKIKIDEVEYSFSNASLSTINQCLLFEKTSLSNDFHNVEIYLIDNGKRFWFDAIDVLGRLELYKRLIIKNPTTNQHYSLDNKTLINLPSSSQNNIILHGIERGKEIKLDEDFDKMKYVQDTSEVLGEGKTFTHVVDTSNSKVNKIIL